MFINLRIIYNNYDVNQASLNIVKWKNPHVLIYMYMYISCPLDGDFLVIVLHCINICLINIRCLFRLCRGIVEAYFTISILCNGNVPYHAKQTYLI